MKAAVEVPAIGIGGTNVTILASGQRRADDVVLGGGTAKPMKTLPQGSRAADDSNALLGGYRLREQARE